jgi:hypothetical protein
VDSIVYEVNCKVILLRTVNDIDSDPDQQTDDGNINAPGLTAVDVVHSFQLQLTYSDKELPGITQKYNKPLYYPQPVSMRNSSSSPLNPKRDN